MRAQGDELALVMLGMTQAVALTGIYMPSFPDVRDARKGDDTHKDMMVGEVAVGGVTLTFGVIGSLIAQSPLPFIFSVLVVSIIFATYEYTLRSNWADNPTGDA